MGSDRSLEELIFLVEEAPEGGYLARAVGQSIITEADDLAGLREAVLDPSAATSRRRIFLGSSGFTWSGTEVLAV